MRPEAASMRHMFLAPLGAAFGEALHGVRLARRLVARGDEVVFLAPARLGTLLADAPVRFGRIDAALPTLDRQLGPLLRRLRCDTLVLVDAAAVGKAARALRLDVRAFTRPDVPVIALDCWNLPARPIAWDYGTTTETLDAEVHAIERRMVAVPIAPPDVAGGFAALPEVAAGTRAAARAELGLGAADRLVVWPTASWQHAGSHDDPRLATLATALPLVVAPVLDALPPRVHVAHVGPAPLTGAGARVRHLGQLAPHLFERLIAAADVLLGFNAVATSLAIAVAARVPIVLGGTARRAVTPDDLPPDARAALAAALPLGPIRAWPLALDALLAPTIAGNPFYAAMRHADVLDPAALAEALRAVLLDAAVADDLRAREDAYARAVAALPDVEHRFRALR